MLGRDKWFGNGLIKCLDGYPHVNGFCRSHHGKSCFSIIYQASKHVYIANSDFDSRIKSWIKKMLTEDKT